MATSGALVVGGVGRADIMAHDDGVVYGYHLNSATPAPTLYTLSNPEPNAANRFGSAVAISGTRVAMPGTRVVVGASQDDSAAPYGGSAYLYALNGASALSGDFDGCRLRMAEWVDGSNPSHTLRTLFLAHSVSLSSL